MPESELIKILEDYYGLHDFSLQLLRKGGSFAYLVDGETRYFLKVIDEAFFSTARQSVSVMRFLETHGFPVPKTFPSRSGEFLLEATINGEPQLILLQEYIAGDEPDLTQRAAAVGSLIRQFHEIMRHYPHSLIAHDKYFFVGRYLNYLRQKSYPQISAYETLAEKLWQQVKNQPKINCHGDLHRGNLLEDAKGRIYLTDFDTVCAAPAMFDIMVMCDMTNYFCLKETDIKTTFAILESFLSTYQEIPTLDVHSFAAWVAIRHFQLQATILEIHGINCIKNSFIDAQLQWLLSWIDATGLKL